MEIPSVSPSIDSCGRMIFKKANRVFRGLSDHNKRWISLDDIIQEGYLAAVQTERTYDPQRAASYATYMFTGLDFHLDRAFITPFRMRKRRAKELVELDAPVGDSQKTSLLDIRFPVYDANLNLKYRDALETLLTLTRRMNPEAAAYLVGGLLCGKWNNTGHKSKLSREYMAEIRETVQKLGVSMSDLTPLLHSEKMRKIALTKISQAGSLGLGNQMAARLLECVECSAPMPLSAIADHRYDVESMTCATCLGELANAPETKSCFGKSYDSEAIECKLHCGDRRACRLYKEKQRMTAANRDDAEDVVDKSDELNEMEEEEREDEEDEETTNEGDDEEEEEEKPVKAAAEKTKKKKTPKLEKKSKKKAKAVKPEKAKKASKPAKDAPPKEFGPKWPFKEGSMMLWVFKKCYEGIKRSELEAQIKKHRDDVKFDTMIGAMRRDEKWKQRNPTHTWDLSEEGGRLKIHNVKYIGEKAKASAEPSKKKPAKKK